MRCMVLFCKTAGRTPGVTYFSLTTRRHDAWMKALGRDPTIEHLSQNNSVCSEHFLDQDKIIENNRCQLKPTAIPMLKLGIRKPLIPVQQGGEKSIKSEIPEPNSHSTSHEQNIQEYLVQKDRKTIMTYFKTVDESMGKGIKCEILEPNSHSTSHEQKIHEHIVQESVNGKQETYVIEKMKSTSPTMTYLETIDDCLRNGFRTPSNPAAGDYPVNTMVLVPCIIKIKRETVDMDSSSVKKLTKKEIKRARRDIELIHNYRNLKMFFEKFLRKLPSVKAQEEEEEELQDPQQILRDECRETEHCKHLAEKYQVCNDRVNSRSRTTETCLEELFDLLHAVDHCVTKDLFSKLK
ncbi:unnamed protein product [Phaedon cochleariae]|uniref:THAP-type domain-containing protein n=1 Tax=Phaedon cochleariae TaxID=80249 RepID=A0A9P0DPQ6_PHACE|nr:unnamed protein product [Phaedon cochleariae]